MAQDSAYYINAAKALDLFGEFVEGSPDDMLMVIGSIPLNDAAKHALQASAEKLGFGTNRTSWVCLLGEDGSRSLAAGDLRLIVEGLDPLGLVAADVGAMSLVSQAYGVALDADSANRVACRTVAAFTDFAGMLDSEESKQKAWRILKELRTR